MAKKKNPQDATVPQVQRMIAKAIKAFRVESDARYLHAAVESNVTTLPTQPIVRGVEGSEE